MIAWWATRSRREQILLGALAALTAGLLLWFGAAQPLRTAERDARQRYERAAERLVSVERAAARIEALSRRVRPPGPDRPVQAAVAEAAEASGVQIARLAADPAGGLQVGVEDVAPGVLFPWLAGLQQDRGVVARRLTVLKGEGGRVSLDATFVKAGG